MSDSVRMLGIAGSLRKASVNRAAQQLVPDGATLESSVGALGTAHAQYHLRQTFISLNMYPLNKPEVMISTAAQRFDEHGNLTDETSRKLVGQLLAGLVAWTRRLRPGR